MLNKVHLIGRLIADPKCGGQKPHNYAHFTLALNTRVKDKNTEEIKTYTEYVNVSSFSSCASIIEKLCHKGDLVYAEGKVTARNINSNGVKITKTEIHCDKIKLLDRPAVNTNTTEDDSEDLPE